MYLNLFVVETWSVVFSSDVVVVCVFPLFVLVLLGVDAEWRGSVAKKKKGASCESCLLSFSSLFFGIILSDKKLSRSHHTRLTHLRMNYADWAVGVLLIALGVLAPLAYAYSKHTRRSRSKNNE